MKEVFLCHTSSDKKKIVKPVYEALEKSNISCWFDEAEIKWGDSVISKVNEGLSHSKYLMVFITMNFVKKSWGFKELNSMLNIEATTGKVRVLPLLAGSEEEIKKIIDCLPILNDKLYIKWENNPQEIIDAYNNLEPPDDKIKKKENKFSFQKIFAKYGLIGSIFGAAFAIVSPSAGQIYTYTLLFFILSSMYGLCISLFMKMANFNYFSLDFLNDISGEGFYARIVSILPNIVSLPLIGGVMVDLIYKNYETTVFGIIIFFLFGAFCKFKIKPVSLALLWSTFGMSIAVSGDSVSTSERLQTYGAVGMVLGLFFAFFADFLLTSIKNLLFSEKADGNEVFIMNSSQESSQISIDITEE